MQVGPDAAPCAPLEKLAVTANETSWSLVEEAARGAHDARDAISHLYLPVVESYFRARWARSALRESIDDAVQDVFMDLLRAGGTLERARRESEGGGFRAFLSGVARNIALRHEERFAARRQREAALDTGVAQDLVDGDGAPPEALDRAWAQAMMRAARERQAQRAEEAGGEALRRVELLRLRFVEGLPIRDIAALWRDAPERVHRAYAEARREFAAALEATVAEHHPGTAADVRRECAHLLGLLR